KRGARVYMLHSVDDDWLMPIAGRKIVAPSELAQSIASFEEFLKQGENRAILIGNFAERHPQAAEIHAAAQRLAEATNARLGFIGEAANSVGGYVAGLPTANVHEVLRKKALVLFNVEPALDCADPVAAGKAVNEADFVVQISPFRSGLDYADVLLPVGAFAETAGTFVNTEGRVQSFHATVRPQGDARPGWKVL